MDGKNSFGRRISLLNDHPAPLQPIRLPSYSPSLRSRSSSYPSSPVNSPPTPQLVRSNSSDSSGEMLTPSPITPEFPFEGLPPQHQQHFASDLFSQGSFFPPVSQTTGPLPFHQPGAPQAAYHRPQHHQQHQQKQMPAPESQNAPAPTNPRSKKNQYPCPVARMYNCSDHFTTSGHAARHAKKHTGKKDAFCPECNKAFTRKDNMEQHRRTHTTGRNARGGDVQVKKAKQTAKRPKPAPLQSSLPPLPMSMVDPCLPLTPSTGTYAMAPAVQPVPADYLNHYPQQSPYPDPTAFSMTHQFSTGSSYGLDALAIAASNANGEKRKHES